MKKKTVPGIPPSQLPRRRASKAEKVKRENNALETLGAKLQTRRVSLGITQKLMAELCQMQVATVSKIEKGDPGVKLGTLQTYLENLSLQLDAIEEDEMP